MFKQIFKPFASLKLTVVLLALSMLLIYVASGALTEISAHTMQQQYFYTLFVWAPVRFFVPLYEGREKFHRSIPLPGGYLLGVLLLLNLIAAHAVRFKISFKRSGILLIHLALILLLVGEGVSSRLKVESFMTIDEGHWANYTFDPLQPELAIIDTSPSDHDIVTAISGAALSKLTASSPDGAVGSAAHILHDARLPFDVRIDQYAGNSEVLPPQAARAQGLNSLATGGELAGAVAVALPPVAGNGRGQDIASACITPIIDGKPLDTYLLTYAKPGPQPIEVGGKQYLLELRGKRTYKPYRLYLNKFSFDHYFGTEIAKNYSSDVRLVDPARQEDRLVHIWMNHPLRYEGETIYQASFDDATGKTTQLQVVSNPAAIIPYIALAMVTLGLLLHFGMMLVRFLARGNQSVEAEIRTTPSWATIVIPWIVVACCGAMLAHQWLPPLVPPNTPNINAFGRLPIVYDGRVQPVDSVARNALKLISERETFQIPPGNPATDKYVGKHDAIFWLANLWNVDRELKVPPLAENFPVIRIDHPDLAGLFTTDPNRHFFSLAELKAEGPKLFEQLKTLEGVDPHQRNLYQQKLVELRDKLSEYGTIEMFPRPAVFPQMLTDLSTNQLAGFNRLSSEYRAELEKTLPPELRADLGKVDFEAAYNRMDPLTSAMILYVLALVLVCFSWLFWPAAMRRSAVAVVVAAFLIHTGALMARVYISGRPPVTNLPSAAMFIAWGAAVVCMLLEFVFKGGIGTFCAAVMGFIGLLIANGLSVMNNVGGDTMKVLEPVLDTNFWLATHVVCIAIGNAGTFLAGVLGMIYIVRGVATRSLYGTEERNLSRMIYGVVCFGLLFSFIGTILGGIWADQSWGRFWGWDPKENGAALIVLTNALVLHARWAGWARSRGMALLTIIGNIVVMWSLFGTNMMGVGLHSYGRLDAALFWLEIAVGFHLLILLIGCLPRALWASGRSANNDLTAA